MPLDELLYLIEEAEGFDLVCAPTERRHSLIRRMADFYSEPSIRKTAERMVRDLSLYRQARWQHDQDKREAPEKYQGTKSECMFELMRATDGRTPSESRVAEILAGLPLSLRQRGSRKLVLSVPVFRVAPSLQTQIYPLRGWHAPLRITNEFLPTFASLAAQDCSFTLCRLSP